MFSEPKTKMFLKTSGSMMVLLALVFVGLKIYENRSLFINWRPTIFDFWLFSGGAFLYAMSKFLIAFAWHRITVFLGNKDIDLNNNVKAFARTQIAKYIPGNVFHLAGRHALCKSMGFTHVGLAGAAIYEFVGVVVAAGLLALTGLILWEFSFAKTGVIMILVSVALAGLTPFLLHFLAFRIRFLDGFSIKNKTYGEVFISLSVIYVLYSLFFVISGIIFYGFILLFGEQGHAAPIGPVISIYAFSWIIGYITPGASGGMGVREAAIIGFLSGIVGEPASVMVAIALRLVTIIGDFLMFGFSFLLPYHRIRLVSI